MMKLTSQDIQDDAQASKEFLTRFVDSTNSQFNVTWREMNKLKDNIKELTSWMAKSQDALIDIHDFVSHTQFLLTQMVDVAF